MSHEFRWSHLLPLATVIVSFAATAAGQTVTVYRLPSGGHPVMIVPGPGGMWFTEEENRLGRIDVRGNVTEFPVALQPVGLAAAPDGNLWFTSVGPAPNFEGFLSRMTPQGAVTDIAAVHQGGVITVGPDRRLWFSEYEGFDAATLDGQITKFAIVNDDITGIVTGPDGNLWYTQFGEFAPSLVGRITPDGAIDTFLTSPPPLALTVGPDGNLWVSAPPGLARVATDGTITHPAATSCAGDGIATGPDGSIWFGDGNAIGRQAIDQAAQSIPLPSPSSSVASVAAGADGRVWFTEPEAGRVGSIELSGPSGTNDLDLAGGRFQIKATWSQGLSSGPGHPVTLADGAGYFWFFDAANPELMVKILDGCSTNGSRWFFAAGLTNLAVVIDVTDTSTGDMRTYSNPAGQAFTPIQDTDAFSTCP